MKKVLKISAFIILVTLVLGCFTIVLSFYLTKNVKLDYNKLTKLEQVVEVYSYNDNLIERKNYAKNGEFINISELNDYTKNAFIAIEDKRFYSHNGIDVKRIAGAFLNNIKSGSVKQGGSTITQQLIKNTHLSSEKTITRKIQEIKLALQIEQNFTKDEILQAYLNTIYFGKGAYGIEEASKTYFNKSARDLTINESAMLAGIIKAPTNYSPVDNYNQSKARKDLVLKVMKSQNYITESEYNLNYQKDVIINFNKKEKLNSSYLNAVLYEFENSNIFTPYGNQKIKIKTYLNEELQNEISSINTENYDNNKIIINSNLCGVIAYNGDYFNLKRSPASCVKPWLVYAPAIDSGYIKESSVIEDKQESFNGYSPSNFDDKFRGKVTVKTAIKDSLNLPAVNLLNGLTINKANTYTSKMNLDISNEGLSSALGSITNGLTLKELCDKYSVFNNNGNYQESSFIKEIYVNDLKVYSHTPNNVRVFSEETAYIVSDALKSAVTNGTAKKLRSLPYNVYAKTGTNGNKNGNLDALCVSYTSEIIVGVWVGNANNELMPNSINGGTLPASVSYNIYSKYYKNNYPKPIIMPNNVIEAKIDSKYLLENQIELLSDSGESFYYIKGTNPTKSINDLQPDLIDCKISLLNGTTHLEFTPKNAKEIIIERIYFGTNKVLYKGEIITSFNDNLTDFGSYVYKITLINGNKSYKYEFSPIKFSKNNLTIIENDNWLYE